ncbi:hypothetical protein QQF64_033243 [Cirrhinus molitorella]|uniref:Uncharacterized protein n=1 Tax=Cirrhinus molitorella TaxID=172907 RepID=A0ABR3MTJ3_9TELE
MTRQSAAIFLIVIFLFIFSLIELINLVLFFNCTEFEVEEVTERSRSRRSAPRGTRCISPAGPMPRIPTYLANSSDHLPSPKQPHVLRSSTLVLSLVPAAISKSSLGAARKKKSPTTSNSSPPASKNPSTPAKMNTLFYYQINKHTN